MHNLDRMARQYGLLPTRTLVPLQVGERVPTYIDFQPPKGYRLESDAELRNRIFAVAIGLKASNSTGGK